MRRINWTRVIGLILISSMIIAVALHMIDEKQQERLAQTQTTEYILEYIYTPLELNIHDFASELYNVPSNLLKAIETLETGYYTSNLYVLNNNTHGCKTKNGKWCNFDSTEQSTLELARTLAFKYGVVGNDYDLCEIGKHFAPNDSEWSSKVIKLMKEV